MATFTANDIYCFNNKMCVFAKINKGHPTDHYSGHFLTINHKDRSQCVVFCLLVLFVQYWYAFLAINL